MTFKKAFTYLRILFLLIMILLLAEFFLRFYLGFCDNFLFEENSQYEYKLKPSQNCTRFRNWLITNTYSMRSEEVRKSSIKVLGFGDSVLNGGVLTSHKELASTQLSELLSSITGKDIQFLNISSPSWGPDNCYAYMEEYGDFDAKLFILFVNSQDAYDNMTFNKVVDYHPSFPSENYSLAVYELWDRYLLPRLRCWFKNEKYSHQKYERENYDGIFNKGFGLFYTYCAQNHIPLIIYLHPDLDELKNGYYKDEGQVILDFANTHDITVIEALNLGLRESDYYDKMHLNSQGQIKMRDIVLKFLYRKNNFVDNNLF